MSKSASNVSRVATRPPRVTGTGAASPRIHPTNLTTLVVLSSATQRLRHQIAHADRGTTYQPPKRWVDGCEFAVSGGDVEAHDHVGSARRRTAILVRIASAVRIVL